MRKQLNVFFTGHVQGVGFRYMTHSLSAQYDITGYVRNLMDGRVELLAEGEEEELREFMQSIQNSRIGEYIRERKEFWGDAKKQYQKFEIAI
jgi:acylphosphatase